MNNDKIEMFKKGTLLHVNSVASNANTVYEGRTFTSSRGPHGKLHRLMAKLFTSLTALFENYDLQINLNPKKSDKGSLSSIKGIDLKKDIDTCVHHLNALTEALKEKEAELIKCTQSLENIPSTSEFFEEKYAAFNTIRTEINELKASWVAPKKNIDELIQNVSGTFFGNSTALIRLERSEHKFDKKIADLEKHQNKYALTWNKFDRLAKIHESFASSIEKGWLKFDPQHQKIRELPLFIDDATAEKIIGDLNLIETEFAILRETLPQIPKKNKNIKLLGDKYSRRLVGAIPVLKSYMEWKLDVSKHKNDIINNHNNFNVFCSMTDDLIIKLKNYKENWEMPLFWDLKIQINAVLKLLKEEVNRLDDSAIKECCNRQIDELINESYSSISY